MMDTKWNAVGIGIAALLLGFSACSSSEDGASTADADATTGKSDGGVPGAANGLFELHLIAKNATTSAPAYARFMGMVNDGPIPAATIWDEKTKEGACTLLVPRTPFCDSMCGDKICVGTNTCQATPALRSVGTLTVTGLKLMSGGDVTVHIPSYTSGVYQIAESLANPPAAEGAAVTLEATGDYYPAFTLSGKGIAPLVVTNSKFYLESGKGFAVTWTPPAVAGQTQVKVVFDLSHHGGSKGQLVCEGSDSGSLAVPATLLTQLIALGVTGYPSVTVTRYATTQVALGAGTVQFKVYSDEAFTAELPGLISCGDTSECPTGKTCLVPQYYCN